YKFIAFRYWRGVTFQESLSLKPLFAPKTLFQSKFLSKDTVPLCVENILLFIILYSNSLLLLSFTKAIAAATIHLVVFSMSNPNFLK
ncbi:MAG: hypothetical protein DSZ21_00620, partial [Tenericutes bacterium]